MPITTTLNTLMIGSLAGWVKGHWPLPSILWVWTVLLSADELRNIHRIFFWHLTFKLNSLFIQEELDVCRIVFQYDYYFFFFFFLLLFLLAKELTTEPAKQCFKMARVFVFFHLFISHINHIWIRKIMVSLSPNCRLNTWIVCKYNTYKESQDETVTVLSES